MDEKGSFFDKKGIFCQTITETLERISSFFTFLSIFIHKERF